VVQRKAERVTASLGGARGAEMVTGEAWRANKSPRWSLARPGEPIRSEVTTGEAW
jgi:hypothetical protein